MTAEFLGINIPFMVLFFSLWVGIPMWMIFRHPDRHPRETRTVPAYLRQQTATALPAQRQAADRDRAERRELVGASSSLQGAQTSKDRSGAAISPHAGTVFFLLPSRVTLGPEFTGLAAIGPGTMTAHGKRTVPLSPGGIVTVQLKDHAGLEILPFAECLRLLGTVPVGRVGFLSDGEVVILPVNHVTDGQTVVFRSNSGSKLSSVGSKNLVGFETDDYDTPTHSGWSVVISGFTEVVEDDSEIRRLEHLGLQSWGGAGADASWIRIRPTSVSGRRTSGAAFAD